MEKLREVIKRLFNSKTVITEDQKNKINKFKTCFRIYFEGYDQTDEPINKTYIHISRFEITNITYTFTKNDKLNIKMELCHPGILIGKGGKTIESLVKYLSDICDVEKFEIKESDLWKRLK